MSPLSDRPAALRLRDVTFAYPQREPVLRGATLDVAPGAFVVLLGPNGSGKTTLLKLAAGLLRPTAGRIAVATGEDAHRASRRGRIGYIPQQLGLVKSATALDNALMGGLHRRTLLHRLVGASTGDERDRALAALDAVGLSHKRDRRVRELSGGERQRVAIARTLVQEPDVIVADELIASLDTVQQHAVMQLARDMTRRGVSILMALHQVDVALANADAIAFLAQGRLTAPRPADGLTVEEARCAFAP